jgi:HAMP domain-containing protein
MGQIAEAYNRMAENNESMALELSRVAATIGREGRLNERAGLGVLEGSYRQSMESVNSLIDDLVRPTTEVGRVISAVADGDLDQKMALEIEGQSVRGEFLRIGTTVNTMVDQLSSFADEVTRVAREVGTEGKLGGQAEVKGVSGTWRDLTENVNFMASNLTTQVRTIAQVTTAVADGRPEPEDHGRGRGRGGRAGGHDQHDGRPALLLRRRGHPRRARGRHGRGARRPGPGRGRLRHLAGPHGLGELHGRQPHQPGAQHRPGGDGGGRG